MRLRLVPALIAGVLLAALVLPAVAAAGLPVGFTGPTWFTDGPPPATSQWKFSLTGSTVADPPADFYDPDGGALGTGTYGDAHNAEGLFTSDLKVGQQFTWFSKASTTIADAGLFMITRPYAYNTATKLTDSFTVYRLDFAGGDRLEGEYYTCGPTAFVRPTQGAPDLYYEGRARIQRVSEPGAIGEPPASTELYGYDGIIGGESPLCDVARSHPELFTSFDGTPTTEPIAPAGDARRASQTAVTCNRGPNPGDPFACTAIVGDHDARPGATAPTGTVQLSASDGTLHGGNCQLTTSASSPSVATCGPIAYDNASLGAGQKVPITAIYLGSAVHEGSTGDTTSPVPSGSSGGDPTVVCGPSPLPACEGQVPGGDPAVQCGPSPLPACEGQLPGIDPVQTCVANVIGACTNLPPQSVPLIICVGNVGVTCSVFSTGAKLTRVWDATATTTEVQVACAGDGTTARTASPRSEERPKPVGDKPAPEPEITPPACRIRVNMSADERLVVDLFDAAFRGEVARREAIDHEIAALMKREPSGAGRFPNRFTVEEIASRSLLASVRDHNSRLHVVNAAVEQFTPTRRKYLRIGLLKPIDVDVPLGSFRAAAIHPADGKAYLHATKGLPQLRAAATAAARKRKVGHGSGPSRKGVKLRTFAVGSYSGTVAAGKRATVKVKLTKAARALLKLYAAAGKTSLPLTTTVGMTSTSGAFSPTTKTARTTVTLKKAKRKKAKGRS